MKTDGGYPRDAAVFFSFTMANPGSSLCFNTHWSTPPVSSLVRSRGLVSFIFWYRYSYLLVSVQVPVPSSALRTPEERLPSGALKEEFGPMIFQKKNFPGELY